MLVEMVQLLLKLLMKQIILLCTTISTDWYSLQNCWQPNFLHVMLKSRCRKILEARSRSWGRTFYLRLRNSAKEKKNSLTMFLVKWKRLKQSKNFGKGSYASMCLTFFRVCKVHLEMVIVTFRCWICWWNCKVAMWIWSLISGFS